MPDDIGRHRAVKLRTELPLARAERAEPSPIPVLRRRIEMCRSRHRGVDNRVYYGDPRFESGSLQW